MTGAKIRAGTEVLVLVTVMALAALRERQVHGVEALLIAMGLVLVGPLTHRLLVCLGRAEPAPIAMTLIELAAFASFRSYPPAGWGIGLVALSALYHARSRRLAAFVEVDPDRLRLSFWIGEAFSLGLVGLALAFGFDKPTIRPVLAVLLVEAYGPDSPRSVLASRGRVASSALVAGLAYLSGYEVGDGFAQPRGEDLLLVGASLLAGMKVREILRRLPHRVASTGALRWLPRCALATTAGVVVFLAGRTSLPGSKILNSLLVANGCLLFAVWRSGGLRVEGRSSARDRVAALVFVLIVLAAGIARRWDRILPCVDTECYLTHSSTRTVLYPAFIDALDANPAQPRASLELFEDPQNAPDHRFVWVPRVQKLLLLAAVGALFWALTSMFNAWLLLLLFGAELLFDIERWGDFSITRNADALLTEGLNHSLVFAFMGIVALYFLKPSWWRGIGLGLALAAMNLTRPSNMAFLAVLLWIALFHFRRDGPRAAVLRAAVISLVIAVPLLCECERQRAQHGHFQLHSFTGMNLLDTALQVGSPEDVSAQPDPIARDFLKICVVDMADRRRERDNLGDYVNRNLYVIAYPAFERLQSMGKAPVGSEAPFFADALFGRVAKNLIGRHPLAFLDLVAFQLRCYLEPGAHLVALAVCIASFISYGRSRSPVMLFLSFFAAMPTLSMIPACIFNFPIARYRSQMLWAEELTPSLFLVTVASAGRAAWSRRSSLDPPLGHA